MATLYTLIPVSAIESGRSANHQDLDLVLNEVINPSLPAHRNRGRLLKFFRDSAKMSQADLAAKMGVTGATVCRWEKEGISDYDTLLKLARVLEISFSLWHLCNRDIDRKCP